MPNFWTNPFHLYINYNVQKSTAVSGYKPGKNNNIFSGQLLRNCYGNLNSTPNPPLLQMEDWHVIVWQWLFVCLFLGSCCLKRNGLVDEAAW